ncbi:MAG: hypothetical protein U5Q44_08645 [Dehalococcoidia bacterium]|nr:hypothetical protein [Dehalococcoidia bacterium]
MPSPSTTPAASPSSSPGTIARRQASSVDDAGFEQALEQQRQRARQQGAFLKGEPSPAIQ